MDMTWQNCIHLKEEIEHLLKPGFLTKYVRNDRGKKKVDDHSPPMAGVINAIIGGIAAGGDLNLARKSYTTVRIYSI